MKSKKGYELKGGCRELEDLKGPEYRYLGHFAKKEFQREGHNFMKSQKASDILGAVSQGIMNVGGAMLKAQILSGQGDDPKVDKIEAPKVKSVEVPGQAGLDKASIPESPMGREFKKKIFGGSQTA